MDLLEQVRDFADQAHGNQLRRYTGERYIVHPARVMTICKEYTQDMTILAAALLHDVLEDTQVTENEIRHFLLPLIGHEKTDRTINLVTELTDVYVKAKFPQWNRRKRKAMEADRLEQTSGDSQTIKYADIIDNCTEMALHHEDDFAEKFLKECRTLLKRLYKGNKELYARAVKTVDNCLVQLKDLQRQNRPY